ncbi:hypothetical protein ACFL21_01945 [Patescibacteria group bacterium]
MPKSLIKKFFTHPLLKNFFYIILILFGIFFIYHITRYYIIDVDCEFSQGKVNNYIESILFIIGILAIPLAIIQIIGNIIKKNRKKIIISSISLVLITSLLALFISNVILECFLMDVDFGTLFLGPV